MPRGIYDRGTTKKAAKASASKHKLPKVLTLTELELAKMEKLSAQIRAADGEQVIALSQRNAYIQKIDPSGVIAKLDSRVAALKQERQEAEAAYREVSQLVEKRLGIKLAEYAYDDTTGVLRSISEDTAASQGDATTAAQ